MRSVGNTISPSSLGHQLQVIASVLMAGDRKLVSGSEAVRDIELRNEGGDLRLIMAVEALDGDRAGQKHSFTVSSLTESVCMTDPDKA